MTREIRKTWSFLKTILLPWTLFRGMRTSKHVCEPRYVMCVSLKKRQRQKLEKELKTKVSTVDKVSFQFKNNKNQRKSIKGFYLRLNEGNTSSNGSLTSAIKLRNKIWQVRLEKRDFLTDRTLILNRYHDFHQ